MSSISGGGSGGSEVSTVPETTTMEVDEDEAALQAALALSVGGEIPHLTAGASATEVMDPAPFGVGLPATFTGSALFVFYIIALSIYIFTTKSCLACSCSSK